MAKKKDTRASEFKSLPYFELKVDEDKGVVDHLIAIHGVVDHGKDISHPGSFAKTLQERGLRAKVLDKHRTDSVMAVVGTPLELKEVSRDELPAALLEKYPEATGAVRASTQFLIDTPEGKGVFQRIKSKAVDEFSYGYDAVVYDHEDIKTKDGEMMTVRNLREIKLYEYSPVIWGMNPATTTLAAKDDDEKELVARCPSCGYETSAPIELDDLMTCPECEAELERVPAKEPDAEPEKEPEDEPEEGKVEVTENYIHVPAPGQQGKHKGHRIRTKRLTGGGAGILIRYCGECKKTVSYLFDKDKYSAEEAKKWVSDHSKEVDFALAHKLEDLEEVDIAKELFKIELLEIQALELEA